LQQQGCIFPEDFLEQFKSCGSFSQTAPWAPWAKGKPIKKKETANAITLQRPFLVPLFFMFALTVAIFSAWLISLDTPSRVK
jgi:hypothetical protein